VSVSGAWCQYLVPGVCTWCLLSVSDDFCEYLVSVVSIWCLL
jgi:hypothetical protein